MEFTSSKCWFLFGLAVYVLLFIFQYLILICLPEIFDINKFGSLGDFIAGFTAPIINMIAAILVYKSFQAQVKANEMQFKALKEDKDFDRINSLLNDLINAKDKIEIKFTNQSGDLMTHSNYEAINEYNKLIKLQLQLGFNHYSILRPCRSSQDQVINNKCTNNNRLGSPTSYCSISTLVGDPRK